MQDLERLFPNQTPIPNQLRDAAHVEKCPMFRFLYYRVDDPDDDSCSSVSWVRAACCY